MTDMISIDELLTEGRAFLDATVPALDADDDEFVWGRGSDALNVLEEVDRDHLDEILAAAKGLRRGPVRRRAGLDRRAGGVRRPGAHHRPRHRLR
jgi:hypothetical protein